MLLSIFYVCLRNFLLYFVANTNILSNFALYTNSK